MSETPAIYEVTPAVPVADGVSVGLTGLVIEREMPIEEWAALGSRLGTLGKAIQWAIGDWLNYGNIRYGETYTQFADLTGYTPGALMNMKFVASRIESSRRRENLSFSHHAEVAGLAPSEQELWLKACEHEGWSSKRLRDELHPDDLDHVFGNIQCPECGYEWEAS